MIVNQCASRRRSARTALQRLVSSLVPLILCACGGGDDGARPGLNTSNAPVTAGEPLSCPAEGEEPLIEIGDLSLAEAFAPHFKVGVAVGGRIAGGGDPTGAAIAAQQYNRVTPENAFKWQATQPELGDFNFGPAESLLSFAGSNGMEEVHGHTIVWHQQVPGWVFQAPPGQTMTRELLLDRLDQHMSALAERIGDRVHYWDVVNEAFNDNGAMRETQWYEIVGPDYLEQAFAMADRHFPNAKLVYNDYSMERPGKRDAVVRMVRDFQSKGIRIDAIGNQAHYRLDAPTIAEIDFTLRAFTELGVEVLITELDVDVLPTANEGQSADSPAVNPYVECLPTQIDERAAERWASLFELFVEHADAISSVTLWGVGDGYSWLNNTPVRGRTNYALLFDRQLRPKRAWQRVMDVAGSAP